MRDASMARHPAGKGIVDPLVGWDLIGPGSAAPFTFPILPRDEQPGAVAVLERIAAGPADAFEDAVHEVLGELAAVLISKQADYGPRAIGQAPGGPTLGVLVRAHDKLERLAHLTAKDGIAKNESIRDSWADLANYAVIGLLVHDGRWPT